MPLRANQALQMIMGRLVPTPPSLGGLVGNEMAQEAQRQGQQALTAQLLQASGPSRLPQSGFQALGQGMAAAQGSENDYLGNALRMRLLAAQLDKPVQLTPGAQLVSPFGDVLAQNPKSIGPTGQTGSLQEIDRIDAWRASHGQPPLNPESYLAQKRQTTQDLQNYNQYLANLKPGETPMSLQEYTTQLKGSIASAQQLGDVGMKRLDTQYTDATKAVQSLDAIHQARELLSAGIRSGTAATLRQNIGRALDTLLGRQTDEQSLTSNTDAYVANAGRLVGQVIRAFGSGTGLSDADRQYAAQIAGGSIELTQGALKRLMDIQEKVQKYSIDQYNRQYAKLADKYSNVSDFYEEVKPFTYQTELPPNVTEEDIQYTMQKHGLTREQVLEKLRAP